jgi:ATP-binding cassette, subfamily G (WHITE), eye pigment precursor transporter
MSMGYFISCVFSDMTVANMLAPILMMPFMLFGGFYSNLRSMPAWLGWLQWVSPIKYALEAMVFNEYKEGSAQGYDIVEALGLHLGCWKCIWINVAIAIGARVAAGFALRQLV